MKLTCITPLVIVLIAKLVEPCNEMLIKKMAINICGLNKRSFDSDDDPMSIIFGFKFGESSRKIIEREFQKLAESINEADLAPKKLDKKKSRGFTTGRPRRRPRPPSTVRANNLMLSATDEPSLVPELSADYSDTDRAYVVVKRDLEALVKECCSRTCNTEDFQGMCGKK